MRILCSGVMSILQDGSGNRVHRKVTKMIQRLESKTYNVRDKALNLFGPSKRKLRGDLITALHTEKMFDSVRLFDLADKGVT